MIRTVQMLPTVAKMMTENLPVAVATRTAFYGRGPRAESSANFYDPAEYIGDHQVWCKMSVRRVRARRCAANGKAFAGRQAQHRAMAETCGAAARDDRLPHEREDTAYLGKYEGAMPAGTAGLPGVLLKLCYRRTAWSVPAMASV